MNKGYLLLVLGLITFLAGSSAVEISAQAEGSADWLPIESWEWDQSLYQTQAIGGSTPFTATITFKNMKGETAIIKRLEIAAGWTGTQPTWEGALTIEPGETGTVEFNGEIPAGETGDRYVALVGIVSFGGVEYEIEWFNASMLSTKSSMIPGFPAESIALGLLGAVIVLFAKRGIRLPKSRFQ